MANLKEIRNRISSVSSTMQITSAMKMVSAAKLKKAQDAITAMRPYSDKLTQMLVNLSSSVDFENVYLSPRKVKNKLVVCVTSNRGLCGAFNSNVIKKCTEIATSSDESVSFLCIGKKGADILSKNYNVVQTNNEIFDDLTFENISVIAEKLMNMFLNKEFDSVQIVYNKFKNAATQIVIQEQYLPIENNDSRKSLYSYNISSWPKSDNGNQYKDFGENGMFAWLWIGLKICTRMSCSRNFKVKTW